MEETDSLSNKANLKYMNGKHRQFFVFISVNLPIFSLCWEERLSFNEA